MAKVHSTETPSMPLWRMPFVLCPRQSQLIPALCNHNGGLQKHSAAQGGRRTSNKMNLKRKKRHKNVLNEV
jgi:hypothetical protein